jgi:IS5 family transposase
MAWSGTWRLLLQVFMIAGWIFPCLVRWFTGIRGYFGVVPRGWGASMTRGVRGHPLGYKARLRNNRIGSKMRPVERFFALLKSGFGLERVLVTSLGRVRVKMVFSCFCFNLVQLGSLGVS